MGRVIPGGRCHVVDEEGHFTTGGVLSGRGARVTDTVVVVFGRWANDLEGRVTDIPPRGRRKQMSYLFLIADEADHEGFEPRIAPAERRKS